MMQRIGAYCLASRGITRGSSQLIPQRQQQGLLKQQQQFHTAGGSTPLTAAASASAAVAAGGNFVGGATGAITSAIDRNNNDDIQRRFRSHRSRRGLYDGKDIRSGNNLSFSMKHTKRTFKPNVFKKRVYSEILDEMIPFHLTTSALRSIDNAGGLDNYLLTSRHVTSGEGLIAKNRIIERLKYLQRVENRKQQAAAGGGGNSGDATTATNE
mmetsp:Transcript_45868/g.111856  ORF Transcript_45868/g.111856 Transcript_45868/m.111856 type:complete len:212 (+) Transcript_45868:14-649(+)